MTELTVTLFSETPRVLGNPSVGELKLLPGATDVDAEALQQIRDEDAFTQQLFERGIVSCIRHYETPHARSEADALAEIAKANESRLIEIAKQDGRPACRAAMSERWYRIVGRNEYDPFTTKGGTHYFRNQLRPDSQ